MVVKKTGALMGVLVDFSKDCADTTIYMKYNDGCYGMKLDTTNKEYGTIKSWVDEFDLGVADADVILMCIDREAGIAFRCAMWYNDECLFNPAIKILDQQKRDYITSIMEDVSPNVKITNMCLTFSMEELNQMEITGNHPQYSSVFKADDVLSKDWNKIDFVNVAISDGNKEVAVRAGNIVCYINDYRPEGWNGPQSRGIFARLDESGMNTGSDIWDFFAEDFMKELEADDTWDMNAAIRLIGNNENKLALSCAMKDMKKFAPWLETESISAFNSGIIRDIRTLISTAYRIHEDGDKLTTNNFMGTCVWAMDYLPY